MTAAEQESGRKVADPGTPRPALKARWLGRRPFAELLALQEQVRDAVVAGGDEELLLVEHPAVITLGRRAQPGDILWDSARLAATGIEVCETPRGGEATLHAPGQLVAYPIVRVGRKIRAHIVELATCAQALLAELGVHGTHYDPDHPGVWLERAKLASIGVHVSRGVTIQGIAINLDVVPPLFGALVSCGMKEVTMISATSVGGAPIAVRDAAYRFAQLFAQSHGMELAFHDEDRESPGTGARVVDEASA